MSGYVFLDRNRRLPPGLQLQFHSRSDEHSKRLGELIVDDLLDGCSALRGQASEGLVVFGINFLHRWSNGKEKTLDLVIGVPEIAPGSPTTGRIHQFTSRRTDHRLARVLIACEEKSVMTEHGKSQPRIYSELNDAHTIVHQGDRDTIAAGIAMINIASTFVSPLRQRPDSPVVVSSHRQPEVAHSMVSHLRQLPLRESSAEVGLEAFCSFLVNVDNQGTVFLHSAPPAPQPGEPDNYEAFIARISKIYTERFGDPSALAKRAPGLGVEEALREIGREHPGLLSAAGELANTLSGGPELQTILRSLDTAVGEET